MNSEGWMERLQQVHEALRPLATQAAIVVAEASPQPERTQQIYEACDQLSDQVADLLDEMDDAKAPDAAINAGEALQGEIEELRDTLNAKLAKVVRRPRLST